MGVPQLLSWLRARHNGCFKPPPRRRTVVATAGADQTPSVGGPQPYDILCVDVNAVLHAVAPAAIRDIQRIRDAAAGTLALDGSAAPARMGAPTTCPKSLPPAVACAGHAQVEARVLQQLVRRLEVMVLAALGDALIPREATSAAAPSSVGAASEGWWTVGGADAAEGGAGDSGGHGVSVLLAVDGVAPLGKLSQQRDRRFNPQARKRRDAAAAGGSSATAADDGAGDALTWDGGVITVGSLFMVAVGCALRHLSVSLVRRFRNLQVTISDAGAPGEGEHKIFAALRGRATAGGAPLLRMPVAAASGGGLRVCVCSNDTDSIVMALLLVGSSMFSGPRAALHVWRTGDALLGARNGVSAAPGAGDGSDAAQPQSPVLPDDQQRKSMSVQAVRQQQRQQQRLHEGQDWTFDVLAWADALQGAMGWRGPAAAERLHPTTTTTATSSADPPPGSFGAAMRSFVFLLSAFGSDFLPRTDGLSVADGALDDLIQVFGDVVLAPRRFIVHPTSGAIDLPTAVEALKAVQELHHGSFTVDMGGASADMNPFAGAKIGGGKSSSGPAPSGPRLTTLQEYWAGIVWAGRYYDTAVLDWAWCYSPATQHGTSAPAPTLSELTHPACLSGSAAAMAAAAAAAARARVMPPPAPGAKPYTGPREDTQPPSELCALSTLMMVSPPSAWPRLLPLELRRVIVPELVETLARAELDDPVGAHRRVADAIANAFADPTVSTAARCQMAGGMGITRVAWAAQGAAVDVNGATGLTSADGAFPEPGVPVAVDIAAVKSVQAAVRMFALDLTAARGVTAPSPAAAPSAQEFAAVLNLSAGAAGDLLDAFASGTYTAQPLVATPLDAMLEQRLRAAIAEQGDAATVAAAEAAAAAADAAAAAASAEAAAAAADTRPTAASPSGTLILPPLDPAAASAPSSPTVAEAAAPTTIQGGAHRAVPRSGVVSAASFDCGADLEALLGIGSIPATVARRAVAIARDFGDRADVDAVTQAVRHAFATWVRPFEDAQGVEAEGASAAAVPLTVQAVLLSVAGTTARALVRDFPPVDNALVRIHPNGASGTVAAAVVVLAEE